MEKVKSDLSDYSCMDAENDPLWWNTCFHSGSVMWVDDDVFDIGHASQSSCDSKTEQESTDTDTGNADFLDSDDKTSMYIHIWQLKMLGNGHTMKWNDLMLEVGLKI